MAAGPPQPLLESSSYNHHQMESSIVFGDQSDRAWQRKLSGASGDRTCSAAGRAPLWSGALRRLSRPCALPCHFRTPCADACRCSHPCQPRMCCQHTIARGIKFTTSRAASAGPC